MKTRCVVVTALCFLLLGSAAAQHWSSPKAVAPVPFDFVVEGTVLPAGTYEIRTHDLGTMILIQNQDKPEYSKVVSSNIVMPRPNATNQAARLTFVLDKGQHVLHQISLRGDNHTHDILHGTDVAELESH